MLSIIFYIELLICKIFYKLIKFLKISDGTSIIGFIILRIDKNFLKKAVKYAGNIITVTGTNGKTTTSGLITHIIKKNSKKVLSNIKGANMVTGIANAFAIYTNPFKKFDYAVLESDEAYLVKLYNELSANYLVVTNLFRDQLDRYGELNTTFKKIQSAIDNNSEIRLVLNADDPMVANFKTKKENIYYGIERLTYKFNEEESKFPQEIINCPVCGKEIEYTKHFYAQEGHYCCSCGYRRPDCKYSADVTIYEDYSLIKLFVDGKEHIIKTHLVGLYNVYNVLACVALCFELGITNIQEALEDYKSEFGRNEIRKLNGKEVLIHLIKNPTGASEVLKTVNSKSKLLIVINDDYADSRDVSWLWDSNFEELQKCTNKIIVSGTRANDMAVRLKYANIQNVEIISDIDKAIKVITKNTEDKVTVLSTYTALLHINKCK